MFCKRTAVSVLFILLIAQVFHHCSAQNDPESPSISIDQAPPNLGLTSMLANPPSMPMANMIPVMMMEQLSSGNINEHIPKYTDSIVQAMKTLIDSVNKIRDAMGLDENGQLEE